MMRKPIESAVNALAVTAWLATAAMIVVTLGIYIAISGVIIWALSPWCAD
jgi:hypothetical protein